MVFKAYVNPVKVLSGDCLHKILCEILTLGLSFYYYQVNLPSQNTVDMKRPKMMNV